MNHLPLRTVFSVAALVCSISGWANVPAPTLDCRTVPAGTIDELVCKDQGLATLQSKMAEVLWRSPGHGGERESTAAQAVATPLAAQPQRLLEKPRATAMRRQQLPPAHRRAAGPLSTARRQRPLQLRLRRPGRQQDRCHLLPDRTTDPDCRARRQAFADAYPAQRQRRPLSKPTSPSGNTRAKQASSGGAAVPRGAASASRDGRQARGKHAANTTCRVRRSGKGFSARNCLEPLRTQHCRRKAKIGKARRNRLAT